MTEQTALLRLLADFARHLAQGYDAAAALHDLGDRAAAILDVHGAGVALAEPDGSLQFSGATDKLVWRVEQHQIAVGEGPCHDAFRLGEPVIVDDLVAASERWPRYAPVAFELGVRSAVGMPMVAGNDCIGAVNIYHTAPRAWTEQDVTRLAVLADIATAYIANTAELSRSRALTEQLQHALDSRVVIEQAKGMLAERHGLDPESAFELMRRRARSTNVYLRDVAANVVSGTLTPDDVNP